MRATNTQSLTDGELFSIIEHGIRLTGMPAWGNGTPEGERDSWGLVHFVRRLPKLTPEEIERMESLNPKTPAQFKEEEETRRFLQGESIGAAPARRPRRAIRTDMKFSPVHIEECIEGVCLAAPSSKGWRSAAPWRDLDCGGRRHWRKGSRPLPGRRSPGPSSTYESAKRR